LKHRPFFFEIAYALIGLAQDVQ